MKLMDEVLSKDNLNQAFLQVTRNKGAAGENQLYGSVELEKEEVSLRAAPYCMWNNRGEGEMLVWHKLRV